VAPDLTRQILCDNRGVVSERHFPRIETAGVADFGKSGGKSLEFFSNRDASRNIRISAMGAKPCCEFRD
jgi:hypothetical protein